MISKKVRRALIGASAVAFVALGIAFLTLPPVVGAAETNENMVVVIPSTTTAIPANSTMTFDANGGSGVMANLVAKSGTPTTLTANSFTRAGYTFAGWATSSTGPVAYANSAAYTPAGNTTLFAVWTAIAYTATFNANGGSGTMAAMSFTVAGRALTANAFTRTGYSFAGWATSATGAVVYADSATINSVGNVTLFAVWTAVNYTVTFNANGGTGTMAPMAFTVTGKALTSNAFSRTGYTFAGWATSASGSVAFANS
ncbi:MAG: InlB B-repeat-containing protein, partial [Actinomycetes bacterium]